MYITKGQYDEEVRKDDVNFWRTSNDVAEERELPGDSSFQPLKRENVYNLWLNNTEDMDFFKNSKDKKTESKKGFKIKK